MDRTRKNQILNDINDLYNDDLIKLINDGDISLDEMREAGLERNKQVAIEAVLYAPESDPPIDDLTLEQDELSALLAQIENDEFNTLDIRQLLMEGRITEEALLERSSLDEIMIQKILGYEKQETPFTEWEHLPPIQKNRTDIYFLGQPGSGKSCVLGSIFSYFDFNGLLSDNMQNQSGTLYRNQLKDEFNFGVLPHSTEKDGVNYMPLDLRKLDRKQLKYPLNFIEMSGEIFNDAYEKGINSIHPKIKLYLKNPNRKILFFVIDFDLHQKAEKMSFGAGQGSKLTSVLEILDNFGTLNKVDAIYVLVTKSDLFPADVNKVQYASDFMHSSYLNFVNNLKEKKEKYSRKNAFKVTVFPYTIGKVRFKDMLTEPDYGGAQMVTQAIYKHAFATKKSGFFGKLFDL